MPGGVGQQVAHGHVNGKAQSGFSNPFLALEGEAAVQEKAQDTGQEKGSGGRTPVAKVGQIIQQIHDAHGAKGIGTAHQKKFQQEQTGSL